MWRMKSTPYDDGVADQVVQGILQQLARRTPRKSIVKAVVKAGIPANQATELVNEIGCAFDEYKNSPEGREVLAASYARRMRCGLLWAIGGAAVTMWTYLEAASSPSGGTYIFAWGAMLFGVVDYLTGLLGWLSCRR